MLDSVSSSFNSKEHWLGTASVCVENLDKSVKTNLALWIFRATSSSVSSLAEVTLSRYMNFLTPSMFCSLMQIGSVYDDQQDWGPWYFWCLSPSVPRDSTELFVLLSSRCSDNPKVKCPCAKPALTVTSVRMPSILRKNPAGCFCQLEARVLYCQDPRQMQGDASSK